MRKSLVLLPLLLFPVSALAQKTPIVEIFGGYSNLTANFNNTNFNMNMSGVDGSVAENLNSWFGGALDVSSHWGKAYGVGVNTQSVMYGPVFSYRKSKMVTPFVHGLVGAVRGSAQYLNISKPEEEFGVIAGGGLDLNVSPRLAIRLFQADYLMSRFSSTRQDNFRFSAGVVFLLGHRKKN